jgi:uncharacterized membrane protein
MACGAAAQEERLIAGMNVRKLTTCAVLTALTVALSLFVHIPIPGTAGIFTLAEVGIFTAALLYGAKAGLAVGALSGFLIDILTGYAVWAPFSLIIHGLEGFIAGSGLKKKLLPRILIVAGASLVMIAGYALVTALYFGYGFSLADIITNICQCAAGGLLTLPLLKALGKGRKQNG